MTAEHCVNRHTQHFPRLVDDQLMADLLASVAHRSAGIALVISHVPVDKRLVTSTLEMRAAR